jgi:replicative DNA helicase
VGEALQNKKAFEDVFVRLDYLRECFYFQKTADQLEFLILEAYRKRTAINELQEEFARLFKPEEYTDRVFADMVAKITKISDPLLSETYSLDEMMALIEIRAANPTKIYGLETGLRDFDLQTHGLQKKEVFILLGEPGSGKSMLAGQLALGMAEHGHSGVFYSLEMSAEALYMRWLSAKTGINTSRMKEGWDMTGELGKVGEWVEKLKQTPIIVREQALWTPIKLRSDIASLKMKNNIDFVVIDYLDLLQDPSAKDKNEKSENLIVHLSNLSKEFDVAILTIQSLVKSGFGGNPALSDISGSHKVAYTVDSAAALVGKPEEKIKELRWIKSRHADDTKNLKLMLKRGLPEFATVSEREDEFEDWTR